MLSGSNHLPNHVLSLFTKTNQERLYVDSTHQSHSWLFTETNQRREWTQRGQDDKSRSFVKKPPNSSIRLGRILSHADVHITLGIPAPLNTLERFWSLPWKWKG